MDGSKNLVSGGDSSPLDPSELIPNEEKQDEMLIPGDERKVEFTEVKRGKTVAKIGMPTDKYPFTIPVVDELPSYTTLTPLDRFSKVMKRSKKTFVMGGASLGSGENTYIEKAALQQAIDVVEMAHTIGQTVVMPSEVKMGFYNNKYAKSELDTMALLQQQIDSGEYQDRAERDLAFATLEQISKMGSVKRSVPVDGRGRPVDYIGFSPSQIEQDLMQAVNDIYVQTPNTQAVDEDAPPVDFGVFVPAPVVNRAMARMMNDQYANYAFGYNDAPMTQEQRMMWTQFVGSPEGVMTRIRFVPEIQAMVKSAVNALIPHLGFGLSDNEVNEAILMNLALNVNVFGAGNAIFDAIQNGEPATKLINMIILAALSVQKIGFMVPKFFNPGTIFLALVVLLITPRSCISDGGAALERYLLTFCRTFDTGVDPMIDDPMADILTYSPTEPVTRAIVDFISYSPEGLIRGNEDVPRGPGLAYNPNCFMGPRVYKPAGPLLLFGDMRNHIRRFLAIGGVHLQNYGNAMRNVMAAVSQTIQAMAPTMQRFVVYGQRVQAVMNTIYNSVPFCEMIPWYEFTVMHNYTAYKRIDGAYESRDAVLPIGTTFVELTVAGGVPSMRVENEPDEVMIVPFGSGNGFVIRLLEASAAAIYVYDKVRSGPFTSSISMSVVVEALKPVLGDIMGYVNSDYLPAERITGTLFNKVFDMMEDFINRYLGSMYVTTQITFAPSTMAEVLSGMRVQTSTDPGTTIRFQDFWLNLRRAPQITYEAQEDADGNIRRKPLTLTDIPISVQTVEGYPVSNAGLITVSPQNVSVGTFTVGVLSQDDSVPFSQTLSQTFQEAAVYGIQEDQLPFRILEATLLQDTVVRGKSYEGFSSGGKPLVSFLVENIVALPGLKQSPMTSI